MHYHLHAQCTALESTSHARLQSEHICMNVSAFGTRARHGHTHVQKSLKNKSKKQGKKGAGAQLNPDELGKENVGSSDDEDECDADDDDEDRPRKVRCLYANVTTNVTATCRMKTLWPCSVQLCEHMHVRSCDVHWVSLTARYLIADLQATGAQCFRSLQVNMRSSC